jgi:hypothetical protein
MKRYFAGQSAHGSSSSHGFSNDWDVYAFSSKAARDAFVEKSDNLSCVAIKFCDVTNKARNWSLTHNEYNEPKPFSREFWAIMPRMDEDENHIEGCIGIVDVCDEDHPFYREAQPLYK